MLYHQVSLMLVLKKAEFELHLEPGLQMMNNFPVHRSIVTIGSEQDSAAQHCHALPQCLQEATKIIVCLLQFPSKSVCLQVGHADPELALKISIQLYDNFQVIIVKEVYSRCAKPWSSLLTASTLIPLHLIYKVFHTSLVYPRDGLPFCHLCGFIQQDSYPAF